ncbi:MAG TPA: nuclear transport factor 2 family protein [Pseudonocardiaceae bacterium]|nr:nuclear transport factor 2 family protein [Pseudonocardiaceae bacterium]
MDVDGPLAVLERRRRCVIARDMAAFADLFAVDGVIEIPFATNGLPTRLAGRETIREFTAQSGDHPLEIADLRTEQVYRTEDPEVVIVELVTVGRVTTTGQSFEVPCIQVFRIRDGQIVLFRDYVGTQAMPDLPAA